MTGLDAAPFGKRGASRARVALDRLYLGFDHRNEVADPVELVRRYADRADQEVAGFCAAGLAFGRVASVLSSVESLLSAMGPSPSRIRASV